MSINKINDFGLSQGIGAPKTQRAGARKPSINQGITEASDTQDFKVSNDKALKYRSQVLSLNRDPSRELDSRHQRVESGERSA